MKKYLTFVIAIYLQTTCHSKNYYRIEKRTTSQNSICKVSNLSNAAFVTKTNKKTTKKTTNMTFGCCNFKSEHEIKADESE